MNHNKDISGKKLLDAQEHSNQMKLESSIQVIHIKHIKIKIGSTSNLPHTIMNLKFLLRKHVTWCSKLEIHRKDLCKTLINSCTTLIFTSMTIYVYHQSMVKRVSSSFVEKLLEPCKLERMRENWFFSLSFYVANTLGILSTKIFLCKILLMADHPMRVYVNNLRWPNGR
jgi:hypothetical protein